VSSSIPRKYPKRQNYSSRFLALTSATLTCSCRHTLPGMSPAAHTGDGATDLIIVHKTSHLNYFRYLFRTAFHTEHPFTLPFVQAVRVKEWTFHPQGGYREHSAWNCDGEILDNPTTFFRAHKQLVPVFARWVLMQGVQLFVYVI
jgi:ceramide kinase